MRRRSRFDGQRLCLYLILAGAARFLVEFVRINPRVLWCFSEAQVISVVIIIAGLALYYPLSLRSVGTAAQMQMRAAQ